MTRVAEMLAPRISEAGMDTAHRMRALMSDDLDEYDMADKARELNAQANADRNMNDAWLVLSSKERAAWKQLLTLERPDGNGY